MKEDVCFFYGFLVAKSISCSISQLNVNILEKKNICDIFDC